MKFKLSAHTQDMLEKREIPEEWVWQTIDKPDWENMGEDNNTHYFKSIPAHEGRVLHVIVNLHDFLTAEQGGKNEIKGRQRKRCSLL